MAGLVWFDYRNNNTLAHIAGLGSLSREYPRKGNFAKKSRHLSQNTTDCCGARWSAERGMVITLTFH
jgi:hypothetical protein